ncbi:chemerin-like receptor 1 [Hoplias malabaricus]|uniref:chemerin-like receptor 1 n=1 Tax=Hoplias malabaricus TaxID=27720 RepID=UPI0034625C59
MASIPVTEPEHFTYENYTNQTSTKSPCRDTTCIFFVVAHVMICILGIAGNGVVIWITGFKMKKSVISTLYLSLAISDLIFCCTLPFGVAHKIKNEWVFGSFMCEFRYFIKYFNMYSSIFILVIISLDRCVIVMFPVWVQNKRSIRKATLAVILSCVLSALLSIPMAIFRDIQDERTKQCLRNYRNDQNRTGTVISRFIFGFVIPFLIIVICYVVIVQKLKANQMGKFKRPFKTMTLVIAAFLICWLPYHTFALLQLKYKHSKMFVNIGKVLGITLANANSCMNPFLYAFMGKDFKKQCYAILSKIENAIQEEDGQNTVQVTANSSNVEEKVSIVV